LEEKKINFQLKESKAGSNANEDRPFKCGYCRRRFAKRKYQLAHMIRRHEHKEQITKTIFKYTRICTCGKVYHSTYRYNQHQKNDHGTITKRGRPSHGEHKRKTLCDRSKHVAITGASGTYRPLLGVILKRQGFIIVTHPAKGSKVLIYGEKHRGGKDIQSHKKYVDAVTNKVPLCPMTVEAI
jgi:hypothetical protein